MSKKKKIINKPDIMQVIEVNNGIIDAMKRLTMALRKSKVDDNAVPKPKPLKSM